VFCFAAPYPRCRLSELCCWIRVPGLSINFFVELGSYSALGLGVVPCEMAGQEGESERKRRDSEPEPDPAWWRRVRSIDPNPPMRDFRRGDSTGDLSVDDDDADSTYAATPRGEPEEKRASPGGSDQKLWTVVSLCLLFRSAYHVQQLRKCLEYAYYGSILDNLRDWEGKWEAMVRAKLRDGAISAGHGFRPSQEELCVLLSNTFQESYRPFSLHIERLMATLCLECPVPVPGFLSVRLQFPKVPTAATMQGLSGNRAAGTPRCWKGNSEQAPQLRLSMLSEGRDSRALPTVEFTAPSPEDFPRCPYPLEALLKCFGPRALIDIVCCVLSECRILFHSSDLALLPVVCEGLRALIYPLQWTHVYLPVVPMHLLNVVEAPVPFMLGTHSKWLRYIQVEYMNDMVLVDCDTASIDMGGSMALQFPEREDRWLMLALKSIQQPVLPNHDIREITHPLLGRLYRSPLSNPDTAQEETRVDVNTQIQLVFYDVLFHLLRYVPDCLFYLNPSCPVFNRPLFISDYASDEYRPALELITVTNCFHVLTESIHTPSLAFFYKSIVRLTEREKKILDDTIAAEEAAKGSADASPGLHSGASQLNLTTPGSRGGRGGLRRTNSGGGGGRGLARNVSVANIIYDKLVSSGGPNMTSPPTVGIQRQAGVVLSGGSAGAEEGARGVESTPKSVQHVGRGLMRHISVVGLSETKEGSASRSFYGLPTGFSVSAQETPNEMAYASLLPMWLLKPTHEINTNVARKVDSVRCLLNSRIKYYLPHLKHVGDKHEGKALTPKGSSDSLSRVFAQEGNKPSAHVLTIQCSYAVSAATASVGAALLQHHLTTPLSKSRSALPRSNSAHNTPRTGGSFSGPASAIKGTPRTASKLALKAGPLGRSSPALSLPVLTTVPSFRLQPAPPSPESPLSRLFDSVKAESPRHNMQKAFPAAGTPPPIQEVEKETVGFEDSDSDKEEQLVDSGNKHFTFSAVSPGKSVRITLPFTPTGDRASSPPVAAAEEMDLQLPPVSEQPPLISDSSAEPAAARQEDTRAVPTPPPITIPASEVSDHEPPADGVVALVAKDQQADGQEPVAAEGETMSPLSHPDQEPEEQPPQDEEKAATRVLIEFDAGLVVAAQEQVHRWTVADLAREANIPTITMLQLYSKMRSNAVSKLCENTQFAARHRAINHGTKQNAKLLNPADTQATFDRLSRMGNQQCDECITQFLQKVVTESILEEHWLEGSIQRCIKALQDKNNRRCLIDMLKNAKQNKDKRKAIANVYPLNSTAFEAFSKLFQGVLRICSNQEDYLCAYGLLEVGGLYFRLVSRDSEAAEAEHAEQEDVMEFLSERTCQHPIYHNPALWCELMKGRVPLPATSSAAKNPRMTLNAVLSEVHALLFIMLELEVQLFALLLATCVRLPEPLFLLCASQVNSSRALLFIQGVASDYGLGINDYYKLQRFVNRIWANNHVDEVAAQSEHDHAASALHRPEVKKKRSRENLRDRRTSMSIGDIVSMQGHNTSKLFRQSSVENIRAGGVIGRTNSMKISSSNDFGGGSARSPRAVRRGSMGTFTNDNTGESQDFGGSSKNRRRAKSLHAGSSGLSVDVGGDLSMDSESNSGKFPGVQVKLAGSPLHRQSLHQIVEHHEETEDASQHSIQSLRRAVSTADSHSVAPHTDSDEFSSPGEHTDYSTIDSPRQDSSRRAGNGKDASEALDEALGLQRVSSAMLMRSDSVRFTTNRQTKLEPARNLPNKFAPLELSVCLRMSPYCLSRSINLLLFTGRRGRPSNRF
jgi:hypothetical protein